MIQVGNFLIINCDQEKYPDSIDLKRLCPLTCGLSIRATVTASSMHENGFTYCLQRSIFTLDGKEIAPQEFNICWEKESSDIYPYLAIVTILLLFGIPAEQLSHLKF